MGNYSSFIDKVDSMKENKDLGYKHIFTVNHQIVGTSFATMQLSMDRQDYPIIRLDNQDIEYLYNKYLPAAEQEWREREVEAKKEKENKIKKLEQELKKLKSGKFEG